MATMTKITGAPERELTDAVLALAVAVPDLNAAILEARAAAGEGAQVGEITREIWAIVEAAKAEANAAAIAKMAEVIR